jgi:hypothetical protein
MCSGKPWCRRYSEASPSSPTQLTFRYLPPYLRDQSLGIVRLSLLRLPIPKFCWHLASS